MEGVESVERFESGLSMQRCVYSKLRAPYRVVGGAQLCERHVAPCLHVSKERHTGVGGGGRVLVDNVLRA